MFVGARQQKVARRVIFLNAEVRGAKVYQAVSLETYAGEILEDTKTLGLGEQVSEAGQPEDSSEHRDLRMS